MILGSTLAHEANIPNPEPFIFFPLIIHAFGTPMKSNAEIETAARVISVFVLASVLFNSSR